MRPAGRDQPYGGVCDDGEKARGGVLGALDARAVCLPTDFGADDITLNKWAHATIGTGLSNELAFAVSVRGRGIFWGAYHERGISLLD